MQGVFNDGILNRTGTLSRTEMNGTKVTGTWEGGLLRGEVTETLVNTGWVEGYYKDGVRHGYYREFGPRYNYKPTLRSAGRYYRGVLRGWYWQVGWLWLSGWEILECWYPGRGPTTTAATRWARWTRRAS